MAEAERVTAKQRTLAAPYVAILILDEDDIEDLEKKRNVSPNLVDVDGKYQIQAKQGEVIECDSGLYFEIDGATFLLVYDKIDSVFQQDEEENWYPQSAEG
jgi:hypothetical protein